MRLPEFWSQCLALLQSELSEQQFSRDIAPITVGERHGAWVLFAKTQFAANLLRTQYAQKIREAAALVAPDAPELLFQAGEGERVALVVWNTTAQTMVPLTDDYDLLRSQFEEAANALDFNPTYANPMSSKYITTFGGTLLNEVRASSLIGDGLASCSLAFDTNKVEDRSRSIVLASDNQAVDPEHQQVYSLAEAADLASQENIRLFSLFGSDPTTVDPKLSGMTLDQARQDLRTVTEDHGGFFYEVDDPKAVDGIVKELEADQATVLEGDTEVRITDKPQVYAVWLVSVVAALLLLTAWRRA